MRWTLTLCCFALALSPAFAGAQAAEGEAAPEADEAGTFTADEPPEEGTEEPRDEATPDPTEEPAGDPDAATTSDPMPARGTSSVVVDAREAQLRREQAEFMEESEDGSSQSGEEEEEDDGDSLDHEFQVGIRGGIGVPFVFALRYSDGPRCNGSDPASPDQFCLFVGSTIITFDVSFGVSQDLEIVVGGRIGAIGVEPTENNNGQVLLGVRAYISPESIAKVYLAPSLVLDVTPGSPTVPNWGDVDFGVRGAFGVAIDPIRYLGLYVEIGVNILFLRSFGISPDVTGGFQIRFP